MIRLKQSGLRIVPIQVVEIHMIQKETNLLILMVIEIIICMQLMNLRIRQEIISQSQSIMIMCGKKMRSML